MSPSLSDRVSPRMDAQGQYGQHAVNHAVNKVCLAYEGGGAWCGNPSVWQGKPASTGQGEGGREHPCAARQGWSRL